jgi:FAD:protein FMN transferase
MTISALRRQPFRAMGTDCAVCVTARPEDRGSARAALAAARAEIDACERALSRFDAASDLSRLNNAAGAWVDVDPRLVDALREAVRARVETGGRYDPTILPVLAAAGYDRSFEQLVERPPLEVAGWRAGGRIGLDPEQGRARLETGTAVDLGGIGKGFAAARALAAIRQEWPQAPGALVDLGGDIALFGSPPEGGPWRVAVADPREPDAVLGTLTLSGGAVATSGRDTRRFGNGLHHLIDPTAGAVAREGPLAVTVVAPDAVEAEAHATALAIGDLAEASDYVAARPRLGALLVPDGVGDAIALGSLHFLQRRQKTGVTT